MKKLLMSGFMLLPLLGCDNAPGTTRPLEVNVDVGAEMIPLKAVQCAFTLNYDDIDAVYKQTHGELVDGFTDMQTFENRLDILSGFDFVVIPGGAQGSSPNSNESGLSTMYVASYADCETANHIANHLAERHMKIALNPPIKLIDPKIYLDVARDYGLSVNEAAFTTRP